MVKAYPAIIHCDLKIKNARPNKCFGGLRRTCQTCEQEQKKEKHVSGFAAGRCTLRLLAYRRSGFLYLLSRQLKSCQEVEKKYILL